jgi:Dimerisation domain
VGRTASIDIKRPRTDDRRVWDVVFGVYGFPAILLAHKLKLFPLLANRPRSLPQVCEALGIKRRPAEAILTAAVALGFLDLRDGQYSLTPLAEDYLLDQSPTYFGTYLDLIINNYSVCSLDQLEKAVQTDTAQAYAGGQEMFKSHADPQVPPCDSGATLRSPVKRVGIARPTKVEISTSVDNSSRYRRHNSSEPSRTSESL